VDTECDDHWPLLPLHALKERKFSQLLDPKKHPKSSIFLDAKSVQTIVLKKQKGGGKGNLVMLNIAVNQRKFE